MRFSPRLPSWTNPARLWNGIELYNTGPEPAPLDGYTLTDDPLAPRKWRLPAVLLPAEGFLLLWTTGQDLLDPENYHTNFRLRREGEANRPPCAGWPAC